MPKWTPAQRKLRRQISSLFERRLVYCDRMDFHESGHMVLAFKTRRDKWAFDWHVFVWESSGIDALSLYVALMLNEH